MEARQWKPEAPTPKWETLSKAQFWAAMANTLPKRGATIDLGPLRARLATPLTEVNSTDSRKVDVMNIEAGGKMVKMLCPPYKDPQDRLNFLEVLETDMILLNVNLADGAEYLSPVVMAKLINNPETELAIYGEVSPTVDALPTVLEAPRTARQDYWHEKDQVCHRLPGARKIGKGGTQKNALVLVVGVKIRIRD